MVFKIVKERGFYALYVSMDSYWKIIGCFFTKIGARHCAKKYKKQISKIKEWTFTLE